MTKTCTKCGTAGTKLIDFYRYSSWCKRCQKRAAGEYQKSHKRKNYNQAEWNIRSKAEYRARNRESLNAKNREYQKRNKALALAKCRAYQAQKIKALPNWVNKDALKEIYKQCPQGFEVDHIVPLRGKSVSGLHVPWNLQYLVASENKRKSNRVSQKN